MPTVIHVINRLSIGGLVYNAAYLCQYMTPGYRSLLVAGASLDTEEDSSYILESLGLPVIRISSMQRKLGPLQDWRAYRELIELFEREKPDIVHTHGAKAGALARLAAHRVGVPVILHTFHGHVFHSYFGRLKTSLFIGIERFLARISSEIIAISPSQAEELTDTYRIAPGAKIRTVPLGFDLSPFQTNIEHKRSSFRQKFNLRPSDIAIGIIGRLVPIKNHSLFLQAMAILCQTTDLPVRALIIGDGELRQQLEQEARELDLTISSPDRPDNQAVVHFTSWIHEISTCLAGLDIVALTSLNEGTPVSLIEASAALKPIVSTRVGGVADFLEGAGNALLVPSGDVQAFVAALSQLVHDRRLRADMGTRGQSVAELYHYDHMISLMDKTYSRLLGIDSQMP